MTLRWWAGFVPVVFCGLGVVLGRSTARPRVEVRTQTVTVEKRVEVAAKQQATATTADQGVQWRERIVYRKGGTTVVTREVVKKDERTTATQTAETHATATEHAAATATVKVVEPPKLAQWSVGAFAGLGLDGQLSAGPEVSRRILGPLWLGVKLDVKRKAGMVSARLEF